jgi:hypothetical protein
MQHLPHDQTIDPWPGTQIAFEFLSKSLLISVWYMDIGTYMVRICLPSFIVRLAAVDVTSLKVLNAPVPV